MSSLKIIGSLILILIGILAALVTACSGYVVVAGLFGEASSYQYSLIGLVIGSIAAACCFGCILAIRKMKRDAESGLDGQSGK